MNEKKSWIEKDGDISYMCSSRSLVDGSETFFRIKMWQPTEKDLEEMRKEELRGTLTELRGTRRLLAAIFSYDIEDT